MSLCLDNYCRTKEDVLSILQHANVDHQKLLSTTQVLYFSNDMHSTKLMELNSDISNALKEGQILRLCGSPSHKAVLCSEDKTFDVKEVETSNSLLLIPNLKFPEDLRYETDLDLVSKEIINVHYSYFELKKIKPRLKPLLLLLEQKKFESIETEPAEYTLKDGYYTTENLLEEVQTSEKELLEALKSIDAFNYHGYWRVLGFNCHSKAVMNISTYLDENGLNCSSIPIGKVIDSLKEFLPVPIVEHIVERYLTPTGEVDDDDNEVYELKIKNYSKFIAESILRNAQKFNLNDFMNLWSESVPEGMTVDLKVIEDIMIIESHSQSNNLIQYFPEHRLPEDIQERFVHLFEAKPKWTYDEIYPFIQKLTSEKLTAKAILTKFTRSFRDGNNTYFGAKHGK